jgi:hypothetical protein
MESTMSTATAAATQTRTAQLLSAQQLREQQETSGREGLASLLKAVRRMLDWLLMPFKARCCR